MSLRAALVMITVLGAAGGATAAGYTYLSGASERQRKQEMADRERQIRFALSRHLELSARPALRSVVAGRETAPGLWAFRAALAETEEKYSPAFGRALLLCDEDFERADCWRIADLTVDGELRTKLSDRDIERALARRDEKLSRSIEEPVVEPTPGDAERAPVERSVEPITEADAPQSDPVLDTDGAPGEERESSMVGAALEQIADAAGALRDALIGAPNEDEEAEESADGAAVLNRQDAETTAKVAADAEFDDGDAADIIVAGTAQRAAIGDSDASTSPDIVETEEANVAQAARVDDPTETVDVVPADDLNAAPAEEAALDDAQAASTKTDVAAVGDEEPATTDETRTEAPGAEIEGETAALPANGEPEAAPEVETSASGDASELQVAAAAADVDAPTHVVRVSEVNAREAPSMQGRVLAVVSGGQNLILIDERGSWGQYRVLGGNNDGEKVWIYGRLVAPAE